MDIGGEPVTSEVAGRFALDELIKRGNGVATYAGVDITDGSPVIVKAVSTSEVSTAMRLRLEHEAQVLESLGRQAFRPLLASGHDGQLLYLVQPRLAGRTLKDRLDEGPLSMTSTLQVARDVLEVLQLVHEQGVLHRDVKPANIIVQGAEPLLRAELIDFGLARSAGLDASVRDEPVGTAQSSTSDGDGARLVQTRLRHRDGSWRDVETAVTTMFDDPGVRGHVLNTRDVSERVALEAELRRRAWHDPLTGLANRALFTDRVDNAVARRSRHQRPFAVAFLDLDDFKSINDTFGHGAGDLLLRGVAQRLQACMRPGDTVARFGGDEFALLLEDADGQTAEGVAARIITELLRPFRILDQEVHARASLGLALFSGTESTDDLLSGADTAMYVAKARGKAHYELFESTMRDVAVERSGLRNDLEWALPHAELVIHYQPVVDVFTGDLRGFEALVRWNHPSRGLLRPDEFIDLAEETGLIVPIGAWVMRQACGQAAEWRRAYGRELTMAVNVSARQLQSPGLVGVIASALEDAGLTPGALVLEITESATVENTEGVIARLDELKALGVGLAIDDFGTGYSSLSYLRRFPVDQLKVDRSFVAGLATNPGDLAIVASVVNLASALGIRVVAEGVERVDQLEKLCEMGCDLAQGFNWLRPVAPDDVGGWLSQLYGPPRPAGPAADVRVLLADDRDGVRATLRIALEIEDGFSVVGDVASAVEAIRLAEHLGPDLIVLDVAMPGMNGITALPALRGAAPEATIVLLTTLDVAEVLADGGDAADGVLDKTRDLGQFVDQLSALMGREGTDPQMTPLP